MAKNLGIPSSIIDYGQVPVGVKPTVWVKMVDRYHAAHGFVTMNQGIPFLLCLNPARAFAEPEIYPFIEATLRKAHRIHEKGVSPVRHQLFHDTRVFSKILESLADMQKQAFLTVDLECSVITHEIVCVGLGYRRPDGVHVTTCIPFEFMGESMWSPEEERILWERLARVLTDPDIAKLFHNYQFDTSILHRYGIPVRGKIHDTMVLHHLISPAIPHGLADIARLYLDIPAWKDQDSFLGSNTLFDYNQRDIAYTSELFDLLLPMLSEAQQRWYFEHEVPKMLILQDLIERGWTLDDAALAKLGDSCKATCEALVAEINPLGKAVVHPRFYATERRGKPKPGVNYVNEGGQPMEIPEGTKKLASLGLIYEDEDFNPGSSKQILEYCVAKGYDIPISKKTGNPTVDEEAVVSLAAKYPEEQIFQKILSYREADKVRSSYAEVKRDEDGKMRFLLTPGLVDTARYSSKMTPWDTGLNAQTLPRKLRNIVIPSAEHLQIFNLDLKQADPHIVAWLSGEEGMLAELKRKGGDLHVKTACEIYGRDITKDPGYDKDTSIERKLGKLVNNALNYGMQFRKFQKDCIKKGFPLSLDEAENACLAYFRLYPKIKEWQEETKRKVLRDKKLTNPFGRTMYFYGNPSYGTFNKALSYVPQSTVADIVNTLMLRFDKACREQSLQASLLLQCHDSLSGEAPQEQLQDVLRTLKACADSVVFTIGGYTCNIPVDISYGPNLRDQKGWAPV